ncbi:MAG: transporter [Xanthomonadaceae bacterium]|jgi:pimeloyl-[acyl-carrier protein] methyl ester esterase|nr:transporter [Xanthomonadaceae bacterium]
MLEKVLPDTIAMSRSVSIFLATGWGVGPACLHALADRLNSMGYAVTLASLPDSDRNEQWLPMMAARLPDRSHWIGWSLGGQWLSALTDRYGERCLSLTTLASNPCFVARPDWPAAMDADVFADFRNDFLRFPEKTRQRFLQLIAQGCPEPRRLIKHLHRLMPPRPNPGDNAGLEWLSRLDTRSALCAYGGRQLHILAAEDALVPIACEQALRCLLPAAAVMSLPAMGHGFPVSAPLETAHAIDAFITAGRP